MASDVPAEQWENAESTGLSSFGMAKKKKISVWLLAFCHSFSCSLSFPTVLIVPFNLCIAFCSSLNYYFVLAHNPKALVMMLLLADEKCWGFTLVIFGLFSQLSIAGSRLNGRWNESHSTLTVVCLWTANTALPQKWQASWNGVNCSHLEENEWSASPRAILTQSKGSSMVLTIITLFKCVLYYLHPFCALKSSVTALTWTSGGNKEHAD